ncbi:NAD-dependent epimerase/dehydratase family protein [Planctobacterium marinum]|uniref:NAD-dependent epimerase/dehydratase family protein n=1 Tax=Planctobacterium marinum TaxID=1631968 RepID=UPI001E3FE96B|nr:NAD-dependent epimerase/dehydratase family protein [Planctobacterium marinum]MCC2606136.1 NAD-dependent epimerase/dehydratase family protein [Planctobacterium marinum]
MKIILTGASGFIGSKLFDSLKEAHEVIGTSRAPSKSLSKSPENSDLDGWVKLMNGADAVIHCAGRAHILNDKAPDPLQEFREANVEFTECLVDAALKANVKRFIFFSSIGVMGDCSLGKPLKESDDLNPTMLYAISKREAEDLLKAKCQNTSMEFVIVRPPLVYDDDAPGNFARLIKIANTSVPWVFAAIKNKRTMVYRYNLVSLVHTLINHPAAANETFFAADDGFISTSEIIENLRLGMNRSPLIFPLLPSVILKHLFKIIGKEAMYHKLFSDFEVSNEKAKQLLNWSPVYSAHEALRETGRQFINDER